MKIIFLDIDGVLNCKSTPNPRKLPYVVDKRLLARLKKLLERTEAKVSSREDQSCCVVLASCASGLGAMKR